jgi:uncharacterized protein (DUF1015 family)
MMEVRPFKAFRYDKTKVSDVGGCIAPPFDVIDPDKQQRLYDKNQYNIVRIIKGAETDSDSDENNKYTRAAEYLNDWIAKGILRQDQAEAIYAYVQDFQMMGRQFQRLSFVAQAKLEEFGKNVRPHERTLNGPRTDRLNLKRATRARFGLPFLIYEDKEAVADKIIEKTAEQEPLVDFVDEQDVRHRLFAVTNRDDISAIVKMMRDKGCIIADGHHRYETGLLYKKESTDPAASYMMFAFVNACHEGLVVLATHRLVNNIDNFDPKGMLNAMTENFDIKEFGFDSPQTKAEAKEKMLAEMKAGYEGKSNTVGIYCGSNAFYTAVLTNGSAMDSAAADKSPAWRSIDVSVLEKLVLEKVLGLDEQKLASGKNVQYVKDSDSAVDDSIAQVDAGSKQAAFFVNPVNMQQLNMVTAAGERMPQKSTYFYPKVYTGLTINKL